MLNFIVDFFLVLCPYSPLMLKDVGIYPADMSPYFKKLAKAFKTAYYKKKLYISIPSFLLE